MKSKVFITKPIPRDAEDLIGRYCEYEVWEEDEEIPNEILLKKIADAEGLLTPKGKITREFLKCAPKLKIVSNIAVGYDTFDIKAMEEEGVLGTHTPYVLDDTVADLAFGLLISTARRIPELDKYVKGGNWVEDNELLFGTDIHHANLGIIGMGRIGEKIARRALGFDMNVLYYNRNRRKDLEEIVDIKYCEFNDLLRQSDFVLLMVPLTKATYHLMGEEQFQLMKPSAYFINCSRGKTVDESSLIKALEKGTIKGAGLDVYEIEPVDKNNPLLTMTNVITVPHIGSATKKTRDAMSLKAAENLVAGLTGKIPPNIVPELRHLIQ